MCIHGRCTSRFRCMREEDGVGHWKTIVVTQHDVAITDGALLVLALVEVVHRARSVVKVIAEQDALVACSSTETVMVSERSNWRDGYARINRLALAKGVATSSGRIDVLTAHPPSSRRDLTTRAPINSPTRMLDRSASHLQRKPTLRGIDGCVCAPPKEGSTHPLKLTDYHYYIKIKLVCCCCCLLYGHCVVGGRVSPSTV